MKPRTVLRSPRVRIKLMSQCDYGNVYRVIGTQQIVYCNVYRLCVSKYVDNCTVEF